jgi:hypothetical protein
MKFPKGELGMLMEFPPQFDDSFAYSLGPLENILVVVHLNPRLS